jgi:hypothetical protein
MKLGDTIEHSMVLCSQVLVAVVMDIMYDTRSILYSGKFSFSFILHISNRNRKLTTNFFKKTFLPYYFTYTKVSPVLAMRVWTGEKNVDPFIRNCDTRE